jgi:hypothetical protein
LAGSNFGLAWDAIDQPFKQISSRILILSGAKQVIQQHDVVQDDHKALTHGDGGVSSGSNLTSSSLDVMANFYKMA